jgi:hypothetical protein
MNTSDKIININQARIKRESKKPRKNPFERALMEEGEFITIEPFKKIEHKENQDGGTKHNIVISDR